MGTWGNGVWQDDVAADLIVMFEDLLVGGSTAAQAVEHALAHPPWGWCDEDDSVVQVLALAALALQYGALDPQLRDQALALIESGAPLQRWTESVAELGGEATAERRQFTQQRLLARQQVLEQFHALLTRGRATAEELADVTRPEAFRVGPWA